MPPSAIFYDDSLVPCAINGTISWSGLHNPVLPLLFIGTDAKEECVDEVNQPSAISPNPPPDEHNSARPGTTLVRLSAL